jgi:hypothetical protein
MGIENANSIELSNITNYADIRKLPWEVKPLTSGEISEETLSTLLFNTNTDFSKIKINSGVSPSDLLERCKDPGLGIRSLHQQGITGQGVTAAIIDQPLLLDHPEISGKIITYHNSNFSNKGKGSMHGSAVSSILVGSSVGVAPESKLIYAESFPNNLSEKETADSLVWLVEQNKAQPEGEKIKVVSVSANPTRSGDIKQINNWINAVELANKEGILVLDCTHEFRIVGPGFGDYKDLDNLESFTPGFRNKTETSTDEFQGQILAPIAPRTYAEQYEKGKYGYTYSGGGNGGRSWAVPYVADVLCLGWQIAPKMDYQNMLQILFETAFIKEGKKVVNPVAFVNKVKESI